MGYLMELMERDDVFRESVERTMQSKGGMGKLRETVTNRPVTQDTSPGAPYMRSELCRLETASGEPLVTADIMNKYNKQYGRLLESNATITAKNPARRLHGLTGIKMNLDMGYDRPDGPTLTEGEISESISVNRTAAFRANAGRICFVAGAIISLNGSMNMKMTGWSQSGKREASNMMILIMNVQSSKLDTVLRNSTNMAG